MRLQKRAMLAGLSLLLFSAAVQATDLSQSVNRRSQAYEMSFGYSFVLDACGAAEGGRLQRQFVKDVVARCDYNPEEKEWFRHWAAEFEVKQAIWVAKYAQEHGAWPEQVDGISCAPIREAAATVRQDEWQRVEADELQKCSLARARRVPRQ